MLESAPPAADLGIDDPLQMGFAFSEVLAHVNCLLHERRLSTVSGDRVSAEFTGA
jgi:hypothetical protein